MNADFMPTRDAGLARLAEVTDRLGPAYAARRNFDSGAEASPTTARLSPWLRRRMLTEAETVAAALAAHGPERAEKFVEEVFWRTYWKGYLETRPGIWANYQRDLRRARDRLAVEPGLATVFEDAVFGRTGIDGFDDWARDLVAHGWLHNHARMWFASIWIFTLRLPWALGADFFLRHLLDGDPASNTLSWRWVAGLHTRGKAYVARADNIARYTGGRFRPTGLDEAPEPLDEPPPPPPAPLPAPDPIPPGAVALLLHLDDLHPESLELGGARVARVGGLVASTPGASADVRGFDAAAMRDALARAGRWFGCPAGPAMSGWAEGLPIVSAWAPVGPSAEALANAGHPVVRVRRRWDSLAWPHATRGFFALRQKIGAVLSET